MINVVNIINNKEIFGTHAKALMHSKHLHQSLLDDSCIWYGGTSLTLYQASCSTAMQHLVGGSAQTLSQNSVLRVMRAHMQGQ